MFDQALFAAFVGGFLWLDRFQFLQMMVSRPIVTGPIVGWVAGDLVSGAAAGIIFELLWLGRPPVGGYIPPDSTLAAAATAGSAAIARTQTEIDPTALVFAAFLIMLPVAHLGRAIDGLLRSSLGGIARQAEQELVENRGGADISWSVLARGLAVGFAFAFAALSFLISIGAWLTILIAGGLSGSVAKAFSAAYYLVPLFATAELASRNLQREQEVLFLLGFGGVLAGAVLLKLLG